jgi:glucose/arabinose dehydrogenase
MLDGIPGDTNHNGGRIKVGPDGYLYVTTGERYKPELAQDKDSLGGKILRISLDGSIPQDNPWPDSPVYSWGHRNPQGLAWQPDTGVLYSSEHGQSSHDEINIIKPGANYGWPLIEGDETAGKGGVSLRLPLLHSGNQTWAPSGMTFITQGPWSGELLVAGLAGEQLLWISTSSGSG